MILGFNQSNDLQIPDSKGKLKTWFVISDWCTELKQKNSSGYKMRLCTKQVSNSKILHLYR